MMDSGVFERRRVDDAEGERVRGTWIADWKDPMKYESGSW